MIDFREAPQQKRLVNALELLAGFQVKIVHQSEKDAGEMACADKMTTRMIVDAVKLVCEAAEKHVTKKPVLVRLPRGETCHVCPACNSITNGFKGSCSQCGQLFDWRKKEGE